MSQESLGYDDTLGFREGYLIHLAKSRRRLLHSLTREITADEYEAEDHVFPSPEARLLAALRDLRWTAAEQRDSARALDRQEAVDEKQAPYLGVSAQLARALNGICDRFEEWARILREDEEEWRIEAAAETAEMVTDQVASGLDIGESIEAAGYRETFLAGFDPDAEATMRAFQSLLGHNLIASGESFDGFSPRRMSVAAVADLRHTAAVLRLLKRIAYGEEQETPEDFAELRIVEALQSFIDPIEELAREIAKTISSLPAEEAND